MEGHHRATAIALANINNESLKIDRETTIALAELLPDEEELLDKILARGSQCPTNLEEKN